MTSSPTATVVAQLSDLHFNGTAENRERAAAAVAYVNRCNAASGLAALLVTGDLANDGTAEQYDEAAATVTTALPTLTALGNHDDRAAYTAAHSPAASTAPVNSALRLDGLLILGLDSSIPGEPDGLLADETLDWAREQLAAAGDVDVLLAWHHHPTSIGLPFIDGMRLRDAAGVEALIVDHPNVVGTVCGHAHTGAATTFGGRPLVVAPGVSSTLNLPFEDDSIATRRFGPGIAFHVIENHRLTTHFRILPPPS